MAFIDVEGGGRAHEEPNSMSICLRLHPSPDWRLLHEPYLKYGMGRRKTKRFFSLLYLTIYQMNQTFRLRLTERCADILIFVREEIRDIGDVIGDVAMTVTITANLKKGTKTAFRTLARTIRDDR